MKVKTIASIIVYGIGTILVLALWVGMSYMEARAYNNATGSNVSTTDAMFTQLRVQGVAR